MKVKESVEAWGKKRDICMTPEQRIKQLEAENKRLKKHKCKGCKDKIPHQDYCERCAAQRERWQALKGKAKDGKNIDI
jgi:hypothetical protein